MSEFKTEENILRESILSILNQSYRDFEFIIVNDGNSDLLRRIVDEISDERIVIIENKENLGLAKSLNKAIDTAKGEYLVRMDTDDIALKNRIEILVEFLDENPKYSVVGSSINILTEKGKRIPRVNSGEIDIQKFLNRHVPVHPSVIMKKIDIETIGKYQTENVRRCEDLVLWAELLRNGKKIYVLPEILLDYRVTVEDYNKRGFKTRKDEISNRFKYARIFGANFNQYLLIGKSIIASVLPHQVIAWYQRKG